MENKLFIGVDLGSTNIKTALYDENFKMLSSLSHPVEYEREGGVVEFDAWDYCKNLSRMMGELMQGRAADALKEISFTGQAESLVCVGKDGKPLMNAISWMEERSVE